MTALLPCFLCLFGGDCLTSVLSWSHFGKLCLYRFSFFFSFMSSDLLTCVRVNWEASKIFCLAEPFCSSRWGI